MNAKNNRRVDSKESGLKKSACNKIKRVLPLNNEEIVKTIYFINNVKEMLSTFCSQQNKEMFCYVTAFCLLSICTKKG